MKLVTRHEITRMLGVLGLLSALGFATPGAAIAADCQDLSGSWRGTCHTAELGTYADSMTIDQQGCQAIRLGLLNINIGASLRIGGTALGADASDVETEYNVDWNRERSQLDLIFSGFGRTLGKPTQIRIQGVGSLGIDDHQLLLRVNGTKDLLQGDTEEHIPLTMSCTYTKESDAPRSSH